MLWLALAAQITAAAPESPARGFSSDDVPRLLLSRGSGLWWVPVRVTVAPDGRILGCEVEAAANQIPALNEHTCRIIRVRASFRPATLGGVATLGIHRTSVMFAVADAPWDTSRASNPDLDVSLNRLPQGLQSPTLVKVVFAVDPVGAISSCAADGTASFEQRVNNHPDLVNIACDQVVNRLHATPARISGSPVASVQNAVIRFSAPSTRRRG